MVLLFYFHSPFKKNRWYDARPKRMVFSEIIIYLNEYVIPICMIFINSALHGYCRKNNFRSIFALVGS